jgi:hypothetical protein
MMNPMVIHNLREVLKLEYAHICLHASDLQSFTNIPDINKMWYPFKGRGQLWEKRGFFFGGKITVWYHHGMKYGHIKVIDRIPKDDPQYVYDSGDACRLWSNQFSLTEPGGAKIVERMMRLKAFW